VTSAADEAIALATSQHWDSLRSGTPSPVPVGGVRSASLGLARDVFPGAAEDILAPGAMELTGKD